MLLRCCNARCRGCQTPASGPALSPSRSSCGSEAHKRSLSDGISGKNTRGCSDAAFMHAVIKLRSHKDAR